MKKSVLNILIGGPAGSGIESAGHFLGQALNREGASVVVVNEIMSLIRGGHNYNRVRFSSSRPVLCHDEKVDIAVVFDRAGVVEHSGEVREGGVMVYDSAIETAPGMVVSGVAAPGLVAPKGVLMMPVDLAGIAKAAGGGKAGSEIYKNIVALGVVFGLIGEDLGFLEKLLREKFASKGAEVIDANLKALKSGADTVKEAMLEIEKGVGDRGGARDAARRGPVIAGCGGARMLLNGNDAICLGAVASGCKFVSEYPMTPSSSILHTMAAWASDFGIVVKHAEDEIAAMNMIVGAGFAGARALTATSGGGFALMTEAVGLAGCAEVPCVVVEAQRVGPSTGLPTRTEQGDLRQVLHAGQGDYPRLVLAPGDVRECFSMAFDAFNYADRFQIPVIILTDKYLSEGWFSTDPFETDGLAIERGKILDSKSVGGAIEDGFFKRYALSKDGVSGRTLPGTAGGEHVTTSYESDEFGDLAEDRVSRNSQMEKRMKKMEVMLGELPSPSLSGESKVGEKAGGASASAEIVFVGFGSLKPILEEVVERLADEGLGGKKVKARILMIKYLVPFHAEKVREILEKASEAGSRIVLVEQNFSGQLGGLITEKTGFEFNEKILKYDGRQMDSNYILKKLSR